MTVTIKVEVEDDILAKAVQVLEDTRMTLEEGVALLLRRLAEDGAVPPQLVTPNDPEYEAWVDQMVQEALDSPEPTSSHEEVMERLFARYHQTESA